MREILIDRIMALKEDKKQRLHLSFNYTRSAFYQKDREYFENLSDEELAHMFERAIILANR